MNGPLHHGNSVRVNGIDIHYTDTGAGEPLLLLDNAMVSTNPVWAALPFAYVGYTNTFAARFRVIVPDTRGSGRTIHPGGPITHSLLADDVAALIDALHLDRPLVCGFSDGGEVATIVAIRHPESLRAVVNHAGYDGFNPDPDAPSYVITRQMLGGSADATRADPETVGDSGELRGMFDLMRADHDNAQGSGHWKTVLDATFERISQPHGYRTEDLAGVAVPALLLVGDRDPFCTVEEGAAVYHALPVGELGVLPNTGHLITPAAIEMMIDFLQRHQSPQQRIV